MEASPPPRAATIPRGARHATHKWQWRRHTRLQERGLAPLAMAWPRLQWQLLCILNRSKQTHMAIKKQISKGFYMPFSRPIRTRQTWGPPTALMDCSRAHLTVASWNPKVTMQKTEGRSGVCKVLEVLIRPLKAFKALLGLMGPYGASYRLVRPYNTLHCLLRP